MLSGVGPPDHLRDMGIHVVSARGVGRNLQDHVTTNGVVVALNGSATAQTDPQERVEDLKEYLHKREGPLAATGALQCGVRPISFNFGRVSTCAVKPNRCFRYSNTYYR